VAPVPKLFKTNILVILLAGFLFFMLGWVWYGVFFQETWMALAGITQEVAEQNMGRSMAVGVVLSLVQATGLAAIINMSNRSGLANGIKAGLLAWLFFALPLVSYNWNYAGAAFGLLEIDAGYNLIGYAVMGAVIGLLKKS
jgi:hypothetical protein